MLRLFSFFSSFIAATQQERPRLSPFLFRPPQRSSSTRSKVVDLGTLKAYRRRVYFFFFKNR